MRKTFYVAGREFSATVMTKGFLVGMLLTPALLAIVLFVTMRMVTKPAPKVEGQVVVVDPTGVVRDGLAAYLAPERFAERRQRLLARVNSVTPSVLRQQVNASPTGRQAMESAFGEAPKISVVALPGGTDVEQAKAPLKRTVPKGGGGPDTRLMVVVVHPDAIRRPTQGAAFGTYDLFVRDKLDDRIVDEVTGGLRDAIVAGRLRESGLDPTAMKDLTTVARPESVTVTSGGERTTNQVFNMFLPMGFMLLLMMSVMTSGQYLLTTTVEEKSNRVVEVLLSAVSAMELMTGKILGQMAVGFLVLVLYAGLGMLTLVSFASLGLVDPMLIVFLIIFYVLAAFTYSALMAAIGSAVNEMREAQTLMMPVMMIVMIPWLLWLPISREPNSMLAVVLSFLPAVGNFVMLLRMTSTAPPPMWQVWAAIAISAAAVYGSLWFAAKVFRVGLLMYGKPPTVGTLIKWARMS